MYAAALRRSAVFQCLIVATAIVACAISPARAAAASDTTTSLSSSSNPSVTGQRVTFTATVVSAGATPVGSVQFSVDGTAAGSPIGVDATGKATLSTGTLQPGDHAISAAFQGAGFNPSSVSLTQTVARADTATAVTVDPDPAIAGQVATFTATVTATPPGAGVPTGSVQFAEDDGTPIGDPVPLDGTGTATLGIYGPAGDYLVDADYLGDAGFNASSATVAQHIDRADTTTSLTITPNPVEPGGTIHVLALVSVDPPGDVPTFGSMQFSVDGVPFTDPIPLAGYEGVEGDVTVPTTPMTNTVTVTYSGDENTTPSSDSVRLTIAAPPPPPPPPAATPQPGQPQPGQPSATTSAQQLSAMTSTLRNALKARGLSALTRTVQHLSAAGPGVLSQKVYTPRAPRSALKVTGKRPSVIATARHRFRAAGDGTLRLRLTAAGRRALRHARSLRLAIVTRFTPASDAPVTVVDRLTVKARPKADASLAQAAGWRALGLRPTGAVRRPQRASSARTDAPYAPLSVMSLRSAPK